jgi:hypothetical protein
MRLISLLVAAMTLGAGASAGQQPPSPPQGATQATSTAKDPQQAKTPTHLDLPVSVDKIREALATPLPPQLKGLDETPTFRIEIRERQKIEDLVKSLKFNSGPPVPGGLYGYEQQRQLFPATDYPLQQPYAAFSQGELVQVSLTSLLERIIAGKLVNAVTTADRARAVAAAKEEVRRAIADYCAAQPRAGAGIEICGPAGAIR